MLQYKMKMLRSSEMQSNPRRSTFSLVSECIKSGQELVPARRGKQTGDLKQVCDQCNMTTMPQERICTESQNHFTEVASSGETHLKTKGSTLETESNDFLGFAPILGNKEDPVKVNNQPDQLIAQINKIDERKTPSPVSSDQNQDHVHSRCFSGINRHLFIYKSFYFFFFSSVGALFPYLAVFYKQLWLTAHETGILMGIRPLIQLIGTPMWGVIADTYNRSKLIFLVSLSAWLVSNYSLSLVSPVLHLSVCRDNATIGIIEEILEILKNKTPPVKNSTDNIRQEHKGPVAVNTGKGSEGSEHWFELVGQLNHSNKRTWKIVSHKSKRQTQEESFRFITVLENFFHNRRNGSTFIGESSLNFDETSHSIYRKKVLQNIKFPPDNKHKRGRSSEVKINELLRHSMNSFRGLYSNGDKSVSDRKIRRSKDNNRVLVSESELLQILNVTQLGNIDIEELSNQVKSEDIERMFDWLSLAGKYPWPLDTIADYQLTRKSYDWQSQHDTHLFTILFFITAVGTLIAAPAITLADTATLQNLDRPEAYGKQRLWGALGWGLAAFIVGSSLSTIEELNNCNNPLSVNYMPCFYAFACLMGLALLNGALFEFDDKKSQESDIWQGLCILIDCQYVCFIVTILFCGTALGFIQTFLYWHLQDIGGSQFLFSTITAIHCISEVIVYSCSGVLIKWFGHHQMLYVGLSCYIIRFFAYAFITNSWAVLPFEILHGLSTAAVWSAAVVFVGLIPGAPATMQGILGGVHWGLGNGGGGVVGGLLITYAGTSMSFLLFGVVSLLGLTLFVCLNNMNYFTCFHWSKEDGTRSQYIPQDDEVNVDNETDYDDLY